MQHCTHCSSHIHCPASQAIQYEEHCTFHAAADVGIVVKLETLSAGAGSIYNERIDVSDPIITTVVPLGQ
jgi:hypothetical protein